MDKDNIELMERMPVPNAILKLAVPAVLSAIISLIYKANHGDKLQEVNYIGIDI